MEKVGWYLLLVILVILLCVSVMGFFKYTYHERDESYSSVNGIYIKCQPTINGTECNLPDGQQLQITRTYGVKIK